jgi:hypothetical protein
MDQFCFNVKAAKIPRFATTVIAVVGAALLCIAPMTFAQSGEGATPSTSESDTILGPPTSAADELSGPPASVADDSSAPPDVSPGSPTSHMDWEEVPETNSDATSGEGQVLEIPQSVDPKQAAAPESKSSAQASNDGQGDESAQAPDELGGLNDCARKSGLCRPADGSPDTAGTWDGWSRTDLAAISTGRIQAHTTDHFEARRVRRNTVNESDAHPAPRIGRDPRRVVDQSALGTFFLRAVFWRSGMNQLYLSA